MYDVIIIGAGPAGLSAALVLGRCRRRVLTCDSGKPRNFASRALHGFITRDGIHPAEFRGIVREELKRYPSVELRDIEVTDAVRGDQRSDIVLADGSRAASRMVLLTTGQVDILPEVEGAKEFFGRGVFHCPYCDGWENRDQPIAVHGRDTHAMELALELLDWSKDTVLCTDGPPNLSEAERARLARHGVRIIEERIARLEGDAEGLHGIRFENEETLARTALFFYPAQFQRSPLPVKLGCKLNADGAVMCNGHSVTDVPGVYVAGNVRCGIQLAIIAAGEGTEAAFVMNTALQEADYA